MEDKITFDRAYSNGQVKQNITEFRERALQNLFGKL